HQPRGAATAREPLAFAAEPGKVRAGAGAVFEQPRLAHPEVHDAALVDEVVGNRLDEAGMRLRMLVGALRGVHRSRPVIDVILALARAVDPIGPVETRVEPLRRVGRGLLGGEHVTELVEEGFGIRLAVEVAAFPAPIGPGAGEPVEYPARIAFGDVT